MRDVARGRRWAFGIAAVAALPLASLAQTTVLIDTFNPGNGFTTAGTVTTTASIVNVVRFAVPAGGNVTVSSVDMALAVGGSVTSAQVGIFNDSGGLPVGMPIVSASIPDPLSGTMVFVSTPFAASAQLTAGRNYWVGTFMTGTGSISWGATGSGSFPPTARFDGAAWSSLSLPYALSIRVTVVPSVSACCNGRGTGGCAVIAPADCAAVGGVPSGNATTCTAVNCATIVPGACCHGATCQSITSPSCAAIVGARFLGGTSCTPVAAGGPNPCCPADFNNSGGLSPQDIFDFLNAWFAGCP
jgi:hypothetical protein